MLDVKAGGEFMYRRIGKLVRRLLVVVTALAVVFIVGMRTKCEPVLTAVRRMNRAFWNPRAMETAGTPGAYASVVRPVGRKSGRPYETPVVTVPTETVPLVATNRFTIGGPVTGIEPAQTLGLQDVPHGRGGQADLERDVIGAPPPLLAEPNHFTASPRGRRIGERCGRDDRSRKPSAPSARNRSRHSRTVLASTALAGSAGAPESSARLGRRHLASSPAGSERDFRPLSSGHRPAKLERCDHSVGIRCSEPRGTPRDSLAGGGSRSPCCLSRSLGARAGVTIQRLTMRPVTIPRPCSTASG